MKVAAFAVVALVGLWHLPVLWAGGQPQGIAARYPGDVGIEKDSDVIFVEGFEADDWDAKWQERSEAHKKYGAFETAPAIVQSGTRSLKFLFTNEAGMGAAGWMHYWWDGSDVAYLRYYYRLSKGGNWANQKIMQLHGHQRGQRYGTGSGNRPTGYDWFCSGTGVGSPDWNKNTGAPWTNVILYTYFPGQKGGYGDNVQPNRGSKPAIPEEEWVCYEFMIKLNDIGQSNGEQRLWVNGELVIEQTGMLWRRGENMVINNIMQPTYTHVPPEPGQTRALWLDSIVLAKSYIGPMAPPAGK